MMEGGREREGDDCRVRKRGIDQGREEGRERGRGRGKNVRKERR